MKILIRSLCFVFALSLPITNSAKAAQVTHKKIKSGDSLYSLLKKHGFQDQQLRCALSPKALPPGFTMVPGKTFRVTTSKGRTEIKFFDSHSTKSYSFWRDAAGKSGCETIKEKFRVEHIKIKGKVTGSIISSIQSILPDKGVAYRFLDAYVLKYNLPKLLQRGANFSLVVEKLFDGPHFIRYGEITRTEIDVKGKNEVRQFVTKDNGGAFIDLKDNQKTRPLYSPVDYIRVSSTFQPRRLHPIKRRRQAHLGLDFELPSGEKVYAASPGRILRLGRSRGAGRYIVLKHSNGLETYYNHMSSISKSLKKGGFVSNGQQIGAIGCTGYCTKPHLHFAVKRKGRFVNPAKYLKSYAYVHKSRVSGFFSSLK